MIINQLDSRFKGKTIEEGWREKQRQRMSRLSGGQNFLPRKLFCLGLFGRNGWIQPFLPNRPRQFNCFFLTDRGKTDCAAKNWTHFAPQKDVTTFALVSVSNLLLWQKHFYVETQDFEDISLQFLNLKNFTRPCLLCPRSVKCLETRGMGHTLWSSGQV